MVKFAKESIAKCWSEGQRLSEIYNIEVGLFESANAQMKLYFDGEEIGACHGFSARDQGELVGFAIFFIINSRKYADRKIAQQDMLFLRKEYRGINGLNFLHFIEFECERLGADAITMGVSEKLDFEKVLLRMDYKPLEKTFIKYFRNEVA